jgi:phage gpG-like protein
VLLSRFASPQRKIYTNRLSMAKERINLKSLGPLITKLGRDIRTIEYANLLKKLLPKLRKRQRSIFAREASPEGNKWAALAASTLAAKRRSGKRTKILVSSGRLRESLTRVGHPEQITSVRTFRKKTSLFWGTKVPYSIFHQTGTKHMPARPHIISADDDDARDLIAEVLKAVLKKLRSRR